MTDTQAAQVADDRDAAPDWTPRLDGVTLDRFYPGWRPGSPLVLAPDTALLPLRHAASGAQALWFLGREGAYQASELTALPPDAYAALFTCLDYIFGPLVQFSLTAAQPHPPADLDQSLAALPEPLLLPLTLSWAQRGMGAITMHPVIASDAAPVSDAAPAYHGTDGAAFPAPAVAALLAHALAHAADNTARAPDGSTPLVTASPFGDGILSSQEQMRVGTFTIDRFVDPRRATVFYVAVNAPDGLPPYASVYFPMARLIVSDDPLAPLLPGMVLTWFVRTPDHAARLNAAAAFDPAAFGLGRTSSLGEATTREEAPAPGAPHDAWLPEVARLDAPPPDPTLAGARESAEDGPGGLLGRMRGWLRRGRD
ncbi:hypothetical protein KGY14_14680 [Ameyamaea chiangmaiensis]|nr:hypothetical protein [Ameyamaea chiangmaiensis]MBS4076433.1 hypothetical protein [Ameyamaea chiangmaiensis]